MAEREATGESLQDRFGEFAEPVLEGLTGSLALGHDDDVPLAGNAALAVGRLGDHRAVPALGELALSTKGEQEWAALSALDALAALGGEDAAAAVEQALLH